MAGGGARLRRQHEATRAAFSVHNRLKIPLISVKTPHFTHLPLSLGQPTQRRRTHHLHGPLSDQLIHAALNTPTVPNLRCRHRPQAAGPHNCHTSLADRLRLAPDPFCGLGAGLFPRPLNTSCFTVSTLIALHCALNSRPKVSLLSTCLPSCRRRRLRCSPFTPACCPTPRLCLHEEPVNYHACDSLIGLHQGS